MCAAAPRPAQIGNAIGFVPGTLLFSVFGQQGTSLVRSFIDRKYDSPSFYVSIIVIVVGVSVVLTTVFLVRRTIKKLKAARALATEALAVAVEASAGADAPAADQAVAVADVPRGGSGTSGSQPKEPQRADREFVVDVV